MAKIKQQQGPHPLVWIFEPLENRTDFIKKKMFGMQSAYFGDKLVLVVGASEEPWNGLFIATYREHHESLQKELPEFKPHSILGKWLYMSQLHPDFESVANTVVNLVLKNDFRIGVISKPKKLKPRKR